MTLSEYKAAHTLTFNEPFTEGSLNTSVWAVSVGQSPLDGGGGASNGSFTANSVSLALGMLSLRLTQNTTVGMGGEISTLDSFGYGLYEFDARMASTSATPTGAGDPVSGGISGLFNFINNSNTEIDFECEGWLPNVLELTSWDQPQNINATNQTSSALFKRLSDDFHTYSFIWLPGSITYFMDGLDLHTHSDVVPSQEAPIFLNHWSTDGNFGGPKTTGVSRWLYCRGVRYYSDSA